jgi:23S rRNA-/tRNA-specific pseudouridylate synthase
LNLQFSARETRKAYHAQVVGLPAWDDQEIKLPLRVNGDRRHRTVVDAQRGKPAVTSLTVLARFPAHSVTLLSAQPHTGYTHQIRAHLAAVQLPLLADDLYRAQPPTGLTPPPLPITRTALHAFRLSFTHPVTGEPLSCEAPYPPDFAGALTVLRNPTG